MHLLPLTAALEVAQPSKRLTKDVCLNSKYMYIQYIDWLASAFDFATIYLLMVIYKLVFKFACLTAIIVSY